MKNNKKSSPVRNAVLYIVSFFLSLTLVFITSMLVSGVTLFNDKDLLSRVSGTTYFSELNNEIVTRCSTIAAKGGVDYKAVEGVLNAGRIDSDFTVYFNSVSGKNPTGGRGTIDEKALADELYSAIVSYDTDITENEKANAKIIAKKMAEEYKDSVVVESFESYISFADDFKTTGRYVLFGLIALAVYLVVVMVLLNGKKQKHRLFRRFAIVTGSSGLTVLVFSLLVRFSGILEQITFAPTQREYNLFMNFFDDFVAVFTATGVFWTVICIMLLVLWYMSVTGKLKK